MPLGVAMGGRRGRTPLGGGRTPLGVVSGRSRGRTPLGVVSGRSSGSRGDRFFIR